MTLQGRTAIVTGASRGIGLAVAEALHAAGANVVLTSRRRASAEAAAAGVGERARGFEAHAVDAEAAHACAEFTVREFGSIDVLVNNAGTNPAYGDLVDMDYGRFGKTLDVNLWAPVLWTGVVWRAWMREHGGSIVNNASLGGLVVGAKLGAYHAAKAGLLHVTRHLAVELAPRVRVNAVAPGVVRTKLAEALWKEQEARVAGATPLGRIGEPVDVASAVLFLAGPGGELDDGETLVVDGGQILTSQIDDLAGTGVVTALRLGRIAEFRDLVGHPIGPTGWYEMTQPRIDAFADATGDDQWIHVDPARAAASAFGTTIAHGLFTLSLGPMFLMELLDFAAFAHSINYGYDRVRFPSPLPVGGRVRMSVEVTDVQDAPGGAQVTMKQTFEHDGAAKPVCVAAAVGRFAEREP